jgi:hypothetical protein
MLQLQFPVIMFQPISGSLLLFVKQIAVYVCQKCLMDSRAEPVKAAIASKGWVSQNLSIIF